MPTRALGPTRPDKLIIWPLESGFGIDVRWSGPAGNRRATVIRRLVAIRVRQFACIRSIYSQPGSISWMITSDRRCICA